MGGKKKQKKEAKDTTDPVKLKVIAYTVNFWQDLGNKAYMNKNFDEAIEYYSKAIEQNNQEPVFYSNRK